LGCLSSAVGGAPFVVGDAVGVAHGADHPSPSRPAPQRREGAHTERANHAGTADERDAGDDGEDDDETDGGTRCRGTADAGF
jgi:hypothetical protein